MNSKSDLLMLVVPGGITNDEMAEILTVLSKTHGAVKALRAHEVEELKETADVVMPFEPIPEELHAAIVYIAGIQQKLDKPVNTVRTFYTDEKFRTAYDILMKYQHMLSDSRICEMFRDHHITKAKVNQLINWYGDVIGI